MKEVCDVPAVPWLTASCIAKRTRDVFVEKDGVSKLALDVMRYIIWNYENGTLSDISNKFMRYTAALHPDYYDERAVDWLFVLYTLNFSLWYPKKGATQWKVGQFTGFYALSAAIKRAIDEGIPIWNPKYYAQICLSEVAYIFRSDDVETKIPLIYDRLTILHQVGKVLLEKYEGTFVTCIKSCNGNSYKLMELLVNEFESYQDEAVYDDLRVCFHSKARILVSEIWAWNKCARQESKLNLITCTMPFTMFCDYRVPQVLLDYKVLRYSEKLLSKFEENNKLQHGSKEELEIRGCSLFAIKRVREEVLRLTKRFMKQIQNLHLTIFDIPIVIDNYLFTYRYTYDHKLMENTPFHNINTVHY